MRAWFQQQPEVATRYFRQAVSQNVLFLDAWLRLSETELAMGYEKKAKEILTFTINMTDKVFRWKWPQMLLARELDMQKRFYRDTNYLLSHKVLQQDALQLKMFEYGRQLSEQKRQNPADDIWTTLTQAEVEGDDGVATRFGGIELDLFFILLTIAGSETTRNAITLGLIALLEHRDQLDRLRREPGLMRVATDEIIRWASPVAYFARTAMRDSEIAGVPIAEGDWVTIGKGEQVSQIEKINVSRRQAEVVVGNLRIKAKLGDLKLAAAPEVGDLSEYRITRRRQCRKIRVSGLVI